jgi:hypothetical protein
MMADLASNLLPSSHWKYNLVLELQAVIRVEQILALLMLSTRSCVRANGMARSRGDQRRAIAKKLARHSPDFSREVIQPQTQDEPGRQSMIAIGASSHPGSQDSYFIAISSVS